MSDIAALCLCSVLAVGFVMVERAFLKIVAALTPDPTHEK